MATALIFASFRLIFRCSRSDSVICLPIVMTGLSELIGSWKTIATSAPQMWRISLSLSVTRSRPMNMTLPERRTFSFGRRFMIDRARIVLPDPDSPTTPSVVPRASVRLTPSTARTRPRGVRKCVFRSVTSSSGPESASGASLKAVADARVVPPGAPTAAYLSDRSVRCVHRHITFFSPCDRGGTAAPR